jgi:HEAT repeat protein
MRKRFQFALTVLLIALSGVIAWQELRLREPVYQGKRLSEWLLSYNVVFAFPESEEKLRHWTEADEAMRQMGINAVPTLLRLLRKTDSPLMLHLLALAQKQHLVKVRYIPAWDWNGMAASALFALGHTADCAAPQLVEICQRSESSESRRAALYLLGNIGPAAKKIVPSLVPMATDRDEQTRHGVVWALAQIHCEPVMTVPVLRKALLDPALAVRANAAAGLGAFGPAAEQAVPALVEALKDQDASMRRTVASSLRSIDPEAAAKAGVK